MSILCDREGLKGGGFFCYRHQDSPNRPITSLFEIVSFKIVINSNTRRFMNYLHLSCDSSEDVHKLQHSSSSFNIKTIEYRLKIPLCNDTSIQSGNGHLLWVHIRNLVQTPRSQFWAILNADSNCGSTKVAENNLTAL